MVEKVSYPIFLVSVVAFMFSAIAGIWLDSPPDTLWKLAWTCGVVALSSVLAMSAARAARDPGQKR